MHDKPDAYDPALAAQLRDGTTALEALSAAAAMREDFAEEPRPMSPDLWTLELGAHVGRVCEYAAGRDRGGFRAALVELAALVLVMTSDFDVATQQRGPR